MCDLNFPIEGKTAIEIASYLSVSVKLVNDAIASGCKTYQDVYDFCNRNS